MDTFADEMERRFASSTAGLKDESVIGVVVAYGGEVAWSDVFASQELFRAYWPKLLRSYIVEALARPGTVEKASLEDGRTFLERLKGHIREDSEPGVYTWREIAARPLRANRAGSLGAINNDAALDEGAAQQLIDAQSIICGGVERLSSAGVPAGILRATIFAKGNSHRRTTKSGKGNVSNAAPRPRSRPWIIL